MGTIYLLTCTINGKGYVGQTKQTIAQRMSVHKRKKSGCPLLARAIAKHGWSNFAVKVLESNIPLDLIRERERRWVEKLGTFGNGYNLTPGGEITPMIFPSVVARRKATMSTPEAKQRVKDKYAEPEVKESMSKGSKAAWAAYSPEEKAARVANNKAASQTPEVIEKRAAKVRDNPDFCAAQLTAQNRPETAAKRKATWEAKREAKLALLPPAEAAKKREEARRRSEHYHANKEEHNRKIKEGRIAKRTLKSANGKQTVSTSSV